MVRHSDRHKDSFIDLKGVGGLLHQWQQKSKQKQYHTTEECSLSKSVPWMETRTITTQEIECKDRWNVRDVPVKPFSRDGSIGVRMYSN